MLYTLFYVVVKYNIQILNEMVYVKTLLIFKGIQHLAVKNEIMLPETIYWPGKMFITASKIKQQKSPTLMKWHL